MNHANFCEIYLTALLVKYRQLTTTRSVPSRTKYLGNRITLANFTDEQLWTEFRIRREDFRRLLEAFRLNSNKNNSRGE